MGASLSLTEAAGYVGAGLAGAAYLPQISHMVRERCVAGISQRAFAVWLVASGLILVRALAAHELPFVLLGGVQTTATGFITAYVAVNAGRTCPSHAPPTGVGQPRSERQDRSIVLGSTVDDDVR